VKHIFRIFTGVLPDYFLLNSASAQNLREILSNFNVKKEKNVYNKQKMQAFSCGMKITIFHSWLPPLMKYLFSYHSMKINHVFIEIT
jgi:hypothetical protein